MSLKEYKSREFCRDIKCSVQKNIDRGVLTKDQLRRVCRKCKAHEFHKWLKENNYSIIQKEE